MLSLFVSLSLFAASFAFGGVDGTELRSVPLKHDDVIVHSVVLQPDETDRFYFTAPATPGDYDCICSFPGHLALMKGILRVLPR